MVSQESEHLPANNARDRRIIPLHDPIPGIEVCRVVYLHNRAMGNYIYYRDRARQAYANSDPEGAQRFSAQAHQYHAAAMNCSAFVCDTLRIRSN